MILTLMSLWACGFPPHEQELMDLLKKQVLVSRRARERQSRGSGDLPMMDSLITI